MNAKIRSLIEDVLVVAILGGLLIVATKFDFRVSDTLYLNNNWINYFVAVIAKMPTYFCGLYSCACLFILAMQKENKVNKYIMMCIYVLGGLVCGALMLEDFVETIVKNDIIKYLIAGIVGLIIFFVLAYFLNKGDKEVITSDKKAYIAILIVLVIVVVISFLLKKVIDRTRFEDLLVKHGSFTNWYEKGVGGDSMPSGHVASALALIVCYPLLSKIKLFENRKWLFDTIVFVFTICVMLSRISMGKHFLSDVVIGALISYITSKVVLYVLFGFNNNKEINKGSFLEKL